MMSDVFYLKREVRIMRRSRLLATVLALSCAAWSAFGVIGFDDSNVTALDTQDHLLTILSEQGQADPPVGITSNAWGTQVSCTITNPTITLGTTQFVSTGWIGTGSAPAGGSAADTGLFSISNDSTVAWQWQTNYWLALSTVSSGSLDRASSWIAAASNVTVEATPDVGYHFDTWSGDVTTNANPLSFAMSDTLSLTAEFAINTYTVSASNTPGGAVSPLGATPVDYGQSQLVTITPDPHYHIVDVQVDSVSIGVTNEYLFANVTSNHSLYAVFSIDEQTLTVASEHGTPDPSVGVHNYDYSTVLTNTVDPSVTAGSTQYVATGWTMTGNEPLSGSGASMVMTHTNDATLTWQWQTNYWLTLSTVSSGSLDRASSWIAEGSNVTVEATPDVGYHFDTWSGDITTNANPLSFAMDDTLTLTAEFAINTYTITASNTPGGSVSPAGSTPIDHGQSQLVTITPDTNYHITDVRVDGSSIGVTNSYLFSNVTTNHDLYALFAIDEQTLEIVSEHGSPSPAVGVHNYDYGDVLTNTVDASVTDGSTQYVATGWVMADNEPYSGSGAVMTMTHTNDAVLTWQWSTNFWLDTATNGHGAVSLDDGWHAEGSNVTVHAVPTLGYHFVRWNGDAPGGSESNSTIVLTMDGPKSVTAMFTNHAPIVSNVIIAQTPGTKEVAITYDVADADGDELTISVGVSTNGGTTYDLPASSFTGAGYGEGVVPGAGLSITWDAGADWNGNITTNLRIRVTADDLPPTPAGMSVVPAGAFRMGSPDYDPVSVITLSAFAIEQYEVSMSLWESVYTWAATNGYTINDTTSTNAPNHPVTEINWHDAVKWCNARSELEGLDPVYYTDGSLVTLVQAGEAAITNACVDWAANGYRLPTDADWEKAARGGLVDLLYPWGSSIDGGNANYSSSGDAFEPRTTPVGYYDGGQTPAGADMVNGYGLYDMAGNVHELVWDEWSTEIPPDGSLNPRGPSTASTQAIERGGSFFHGPGLLRCSMRFDTGKGAVSFYTGFRCVRKL